MQDSMEKRVLLIPVSKEQDHIVQAKAANKEAAQPQWVGNTNERKLMQHVRHGRRHRSEEGGI